LPHAGRSQNRTSCELASQIRYLAEQIREGDWASQHGQRERGRYRTQGFV
jgi:hypothetical protein